MVLPKVRTRRYGDTNTVSRSTPLQAWPQKTDDTAGTGQTSALALACDEVRKSKPNRVIIKRAPNRDPGCVLEYWRVDGGDADVTGEKACRSAEAVKLELIENFRAKSLTVVMEW